MRKVYPSYDPRGKIKFQEIENDLILGIPNTSSKQWRTSNEFNVQVDINEYGFRDKKELKHSSSDDIFIVGDSFGFGHGVEEEERFGNILDSLFSPEKTIYNIAISRSNILHYKKRLNYAKRIGGNVKNIIVGVCMENDIMDYSEVLKNKKSTFKQGSYSVKDWLNKKSCLYNFIAINSKSNLKWRSFLENLGVIKNEIYELNRETDKELKNSVEQLLEVIKGYNSLVILIPSRMIWEEGRKDIAEESHNKFKELLIIEKIKYLDLKPLLEEHDKNPLNSLHFKYDGHWNKYGHKVVAHAIFEEWNRIELSGISKKSVDSILFE